MTQPILELMDIHKRFPGVHALSGVSFDMYPGEVHALLGENGAGKSTLIKIMSGVYQPDQGKIRMDGQPVQFARSARGAASRHRRHLSGADGLPRSQRRGEYLH